LTLTTFLAIAVSDEISAFTPVRELTRLRSLFRSPTSVPFRVDSSSSPAFLSPSAPILETPSTFPGLSADGVSRRRSASLSQERLVTCSAVDGL
jgi:hypothetical protein